MTQAYTAFGFTAAADTKRTWEREVAIDFEPEGARVVAFVEAPDDVD